MRTRRQLILNIIGLWALLAIGITVALLIGRTGTPDAPPPLLYETGTTYHTDVALLDPISRVSINLTANPARDTTPAWLPDGIRISFASNRGGTDMDLYTMDLRTRATTAVLDTTQQSIALNYSPDGSQAVYLEGNGTTYTDVMLIDRDGTHRQVTRNGIVASAPVWSPDGTQIVFVNAALNIPDVFVADIANASRPRRLTRNAMASSPVWMPDGTQIAYSARSERNWRLVFLVDVATGEQRKVFEGADTWLLAWSPDVEHIAFIGGGGEARDLHIAQFDPDPAREVDFDAERITEGLVINTLRWSSDGEWLVFTARPVEQAWTDFVAGDGGVDALQGGPFSRLRYRLHSWLWQNRPWDIAREELYMYRLGWDAPRRLTHTTDVERQPSWQPVALTSDAEPVE
jgi:Tol biopolymer transport system component